MQPDSETQLLTIQFEWNGVLKSVSSSLIGVSPEFEVAIYTLCFFVGGEENHVEIGPYPVNIKCYRLGDNIGSAFPVAECWMPHIISVISHVKKDYSPSCRNLHYKQQKRLTTIVVLLDHICLWSINFYLRNTLVWYHPCVFIAVIFPLLLSALNSRYVRVKWKCWIFFS